VRAKKRIKFDVTLRKFELKSVYLKAFIRSSLQKVTWFEVRVERRNC